MSHFTHASTFMRIAHIFEASQVLQFLMQIQFLTDKLRSYSHRYHPFEYTTTDN